MLKRWKVEGADLGVVKLVEGAEMINKELEKCRRLEDLYAADIEAENNLGKSG